MLSLYFLLEIYIQFKKKKAKRKENFLLHGSRYLSYCLLDPVTSLSSIKRSEKKVYIIYDFSPSATLLCSGDSPCPCTQNKSCFSSLKSRSSIYRLPISFFFLASIFICSFIVYCCALRMRLPARPVFFFIFIFAIGICSPFVLFKYCFD